MTGMSLPFHLFKRGSITMTSILTNSAAMAALSTLRSINDGMETTQGRVSSGLRVETAADNAAYWSIATTMKSDNKALSTVQDALGLGAAKTDTAYTGLEHGHRRRLRNQGQAGCCPRTGCRQAEDQQGTDRTQEPAGFDRPVGFLLRRKLALQRHDALRSAPRKWSARSPVAADGNVSVGVLKFDAATSVLIDTNDCATRPC